MECTAERKESRPEMEKDAARSSFEIDLKTWLRRVIRGARGQERKTGDAEERVSFGDGLRSKRPPMGRRGYGTVL